MAAHLKSAVAPAIALHQHVNQMIKPHPTRSIRILILTMSLLSPVASILYITSAIKRQRTNGLWLFKLEPDGYLRPNIHTVIPLFVVIYTILNLVSLVSLQVDFETVIKPRSVVLHLITYPILFSMAWTKVWTVFNAIPPTKQGLQISRNPNASPNERSISPRASNTIAILAYAVPIIFSMMFIFPVEREITKINKIWVDYEAAFQTTMTVLSSGASMKQREFSAPIILKHLLHHSQTLLFILKVTTGGYFSMLIALLFCALYAYFHIFRALRFQISVLRQSIRRRMDFAQSPIGSSTDPDALRVCDKGNSKSSFSLTKSQTTTGRLNDYSKSWFPCLHTEVNRSLWKSEIFTRSKQEWEIAHESLISSEYKALKRYRANIIWQALLACVIMASYMVMDILILANVLDVPRSNTLVNLTVLMIAWANISWNLGMGILLGIISCIIAFWPPPELTREEHQLEEYDW